MHTQMTSCVAEGLSEEDTALFCWRARDRPDTRKESGANALGSAQERRDRHSQGRACDAQEGSPLFGTFSGHRRLMFLARKEVPAFVFFPGYINI
jgi:hypothetical protein